MSLCLCASLAGPFCWDHVPGPLIKRAGFFHINASKGCSAGHWLLHLVQIKEQKHQLANISTNDCSGYSNNHSYNNNSNEGNKNLLVLNPATRKERKLRLLINSQIHNTSNVSMFAQYSFVTKL